MLAAIYFMNNNSQYIALSDFGFLANVLGYGDFKSHKNKTAIGKERIGRHLGNMMSGIIAVITAVLVVNVNIETGWIWWVLTTPLMTPSLFGGKLKS